MTNVAPVRVGFVGCGEHARMSLYPSLRSAFGGSPSGLPALVLTQQGRGQPPLLAELVALADHKRDLAERVAAFHGVRRVYTDHVTMLEAEQLDAVVVCMHPRRQAQVAIDCLERGVHVWVEKPPAETVHEARRMAEAAERTGKHLAVGYMKRFSYPYQRAKAFTQRPGFGEPSVFESRFTYGRYPVDVYHFLNGFATHHLDLPRFFMGEIESVSAERVVRGIGLEGYALSLRFANGGIGVVNVNCLEGEHNNWSERVAVTGVGGRVFVENWRRVVGFLPDDPQTYYWEPEDIRPADDQNSLAIHGCVGELRDFVESVREGRAPACTIDDGIAALRLERATALSVERGARVSLIEAGDDIA
ncbi:MAG: Gfo/Idh/MocA family oxidoreductase [Chloroflexi bacterium]|nr:Gfo/Idh/MocA family oxidoreductase [Chloroflexota bacterium]